MASPEPDTQDPWLPLDGGCNCRQIRYRLVASPLFVHCCHCRWCQRETGAAFALNAMVESDRILLLAGTPELVLTPSASGKGQQIARCPTCRIAVWSHYAGAGPLLSFLRDEECDAIQGFYFSRAIPAEDFAELVRRAPDWLI